MYYNIITVKYTKENPVLNCNERWKPVKNFEDLYWVSDQGRIKNSRKIMKTYINNSGYVCIDFTKNKIKSKHLVHRLVCSAFALNLRNLPEVNHKNENKQDNRLVNLEWCSSSQNKQHSLKTGRYSKIFETKNTLGKKHLKHTLSKYHNVSFDKNRNKWVGQIRHNNKNYYMKRFNTEVEAALHVNWIIDTLDLKDRPKNIV